MSAGHSADHSADWNRISQQPLQHLTLISRIQFILTDHLTTHLNISPVSLKLKVEYNLSHNFQRKGKAMQKTKQTLSTWEK